MESQSNRILNLAVVVGALGYFVDIYDLVLFSIVRLSSLRELGIAEGQVLEVGVTLLNMQMTGLLVGGILWGVLGDKRGRLSVLFGSIFLYSVANLLNAFVTNIPTYGVLRFVAGVGLAGELGAAITLVSEVMSKETRGYGTMVVAAVGLSGAVFAGLLGDHLHWRSAYFVGGVLGLILLGMRVGLLESGLYRSLKGTDVRRGDLTLLLGSQEHLLKYAYCILIGVPIWFVVGILITFSPELSAALGVQGTVAAGRSILFCYAGISVGDLFSGWLSQYLKSRKRTVRLSLGILTLLLISYLYFKGLELSTFYLLCFLLGFGTGYWAVFVTIAAEQFGTNLRATVATSVPNFVRGSVVPLSLAFKFLIPHVGIVHSAFLVGLGALLIASLALWKLEETYGKDLDFLEVQDD